MLTAAIVLGPQRRVKTVREAVAELVPDASGPLVAVTAGWEERESEDEELREHVGRPLVNLGVWQRIERIFAADPELFEAMRQRHAQLRRMQELYRMRLLGLMDPLCELHRRDDDPELLEPEREAALELVQTLDRQHEARVQAVHEEFESRWQPLQRDAVAKQRAELERELAGASCLLVAGGHVAVLLHRLRLFDLPGLWGDRPLVAWSAGAMVLCERIVLFHDSPPQGSHYPEVMERGFGLLPGFVALPHAVHRLQLDDERSMRVLARRFDPAHAALLDRGAQFEWDGRVWSATAGSRILGRDGLPAEVPA
ncbi:MAG: Type 1 glutamine amidotransferase-like domain-containing protein [bacterium]|nr:Type 1 glutamine amidotransferase-like domain-containing protein [bacterium]